MAGKGSKRRPTEISEKEQELRWDAILTNMSDEEFWNRLDKIRKEEGNDGL